MASRIAAGAVIIAVLAGLLVFSQFRPVPPKVSGFIEADEIRLGSRVGGRVAEVFVAEGDRVEAGQRLVRLEPFDLAEQLRVAESQLAERQAELDKLQAGLRPEEIQQAEARHQQLAARLELLKNGPRPEEIEAARQAVEAAAAEFVLAEQQFGRVSQLFRSNSASQQDFDMADQRLKSARAAVGIRQNELAVLEAGTRTEEIAEAQAKVAESLAALELARAGFRDEEIQRALAARDAAQAARDAVRQQLSELDILSPSGGVIEALELQPGDLVAPGAPVLSMLGEGPLWVRAYLPENRLATRVGDEMTITADSFPNTRFTGLVTFIARQAEFTPANVQTVEERSKQVFRVKVTLDEEASGMLRPGMVVDLWLDRAAD